MKPSALIHTLLLTLITAVAWCLPASAGEPWRVSLLTCSPGSEIYELEGHSGLRLRNDSAGVDIVVNWGLFDFASPGFVYRFVKGETDYMAGAAPTGLFVDMYAREGRGVDEQVLALTPEEALRAVALIEENLRPENRTYRYNYVADNCATRPLAIIERAMADTVTLGSAEPAIEAAPSFREAMRYYHRRHPWYQFGIDLALGSPIDRREPRRAMTFSPLALEQMAAGTTRPDGAPLVTATATLVPHRAAAPEPTPWYLGPLFWCWVLAAVTVGVTAADLRRRRMSRGFDAALYGVFGLAGCLITFLVFFSVHEPASPNLLLLWLNPLCLLVPLLVWSKWGRRLLMWWQMINFVALLALSVSALAGAQSLNSAFIPLIISDAVRSIFYIYQCRHTARIQRTASPTPSPAC